MNHLPHDAIGHAGQVAPQGLRDLLELGPQRLVDEALGHPGHDRGVALAAVAVGPDPVSPQQGDEDLARPHVRHGEAVLDRRILFFPELQPFENSIPGSLGSDLLTFGGRTGEERLYQPQLVDEPGFIPSCLSPPAFLLLGRLSHDPLQHLDPVPGLLLDGLDDAIAGCLPPALWI